MTTWLVHLVTDRGAGDPARAELAARIGLGLPNAVIHVTSVPACDTLAAGCCVAQLVLGGPISRRIVAHDVAPGPGDPGPWPPGANGVLCVGRAPGGALIVGPSVGWTWSFAVERLWGLCALELARTARDRLPAAIVRAGMGHPHAIADAVPRSSVPRLPPDAIAFADERGALQTTIAALPAAAGARVRVCIGDVADEATVTDGSVDLRAGELALRPAPTGHLELLVPGGSATDRFGAPASGTPIEITTAG